MNNREEQKEPGRQEDHWLVRPATVRKLWIGFSVVLALTVGAQFFIKIKGYFGVDGWFGFGAIYGLIACVLMVVVARLLGKFLKRRDDYYDV
tara:strand:- start:5840 stop:6115 length:276 start_codon:yes stop_codon:yes gene_type:complete